VVPDRQLLDLVGSNLRSTSKISNTYHIIEKTQKKKLGNLKILY